MANSPGRLNTRHMIALLQVNLADRWDAQTEAVTIAVIGKYTNLADAYLSVIKALQHACLAARRKLRLLWVEAGDIEDEVSGCQEPGFVLLLSLLHGFAGCGCDMTNCCCDAAGTTSCVSGSAGQAEVAVMQTLQLCMCCRRWWRMRQNTSRRGRLSKKRTASSSLAALACEASRAKSRPRATAGRSGNPSWASASACRCAAAASTEA